MFLEPVPASYLKDLRTNRPVRPSGSRPLPSKSSAGSTTTAQGNENENLPPRASSAMSSYIESAAEKESPPRATSAMSNFRMSYGSSSGRPLAQEPRSVSIRKNVSPPSVSSRPVPVSPNAAYRENGVRRMEKEEARSLRDALEEMDHDETRIHQAAQDEASELVWSHQNPGVPYKNPPSAFRNPDLEKPRQGSVGHSPSQNRGFRRNFMSSSQRRDSRQSTSDTSSERQQTASTEDSSRRRSVLESPTSDGATPKKLGSFRKNLKVNFALPADDSPSKTPISENETEKTGSEEPSKGIFRNPQDHIYEEPKGSQPDTVNEKPDFSRSDSSALRTRPRNAQPRGSRPFPGRLTNLPFVDKLARFDLNRSSSTQSRNPDYKTNDTVAEPVADAKTPDEEAVPTKDGIEIRSDEIRAATSKRRTDRSSNLPMPTAVSDKTGRPIVSFDPTWKPTEAESPPRKHDSMRERESVTPTPPREQPPAPTIEVSEAPSIPVINLPDTKEPTISEMDAGAVKAPEEGRRPLPEPTKANGQGSNASSRRKLPTVSENRWYSPYTRAGVPAAKCESCTLPIAGKIVTASGSRFHPECFVCHHCQTALECVGFYQEPEAKRNERLAEAPEDDEEARVVRFFCHLDFHELFSPRCKSCKTPIEGEVVVACGSEWHVGHFFCAECGDVSEPISIVELVVSITNFSSQPFDSQTPFVEKDGFAWCLHCYSRRTAPKCLGCKKPVQEDVVITAIGGQWHDECFKCHECGHGFGPDGQFFVREGEPRRTAKGRIIGGPVQLAICEGCESIRLKTASFKR